MTRKAALSALLLFAVLVAYAPGGAAQTEFIKLDRGNTDEPRADADQVTARFPVTLVDVQGEAITLAVLDVVRNKQRESRLIAAFTPRMEPVTPGRAPALLVDVDLRQAREPGAYQVFIQATAKKKDQSEAKQAVELQINIPAATLRPPPALKIERVKPFYLFFSAADEKPSLDLKETSRRSRLTDVTFSQTAISDSNNQPLTGSLAVAPLAAPIAPGEQVSAAYQLKGDFPLGTVHGTLDIEAPQLAAAVPVSFEARTRIHPWVIFLIIGLGLVAGWFTRVYLQRRIALNQALLAANDLQQRFEDERKAHQDEDWRNALPTIEAPLRAAIKAEKAADITSAVQIANTALTDSLNQLRTRHAAAQAKLDELQALVSMTWTLPDEIKQALLAIRPALDEARGLLVVDNVKAASQSLDDRRKGLAGSLSPVVLAWRTDLKNDLIELTASTAPLPATVAEKLQLAVTSMTTLLDLVTDIAADATSEAMRGSLAALHTARLNALSLMHQVNVWHQLATKEVIATLQQAKLPDADALKRLEERITESSKQFEAAVEAPGAALNQWPTTSDNLRRAWHEALLNQIPNAPNGKRAEVEQLITERKYGDAAGKVVEIIKTTRSTEGRSLGMLATMAPRLAALLSDWSPRSSLIDTAAPASRAAPVALTVPPLEVARLRSRTELALATGLQTLIAGIFIAIVGYTLFAATFIGTAGEVAAIFFWAFGLDVTIDRLLGAIQKIKML